jgi:hypothetical protein
MVSSFLREKLFCFVKKGIKTEILQRYKIPLELQFGIFWEFRFIIGLPTPGLLLEVNRRSYGLVKTYWFGMEMSTIIADFYFAMSHCRARSKNHSFRKKPSVSTSDSNRALRGGVS